MGKKATSPSVQLKVLLKKEEIQQRVRTLAGEVHGIYAARREPWMILGLLNGALFFLTDLLRALPVPVPFECWRVSSYPGETTTSSGQLQGLESAFGDFDGQHVLIVDDILDTGLTLNLVAREVMARGARSVRICVLLEKECERRISVRADLVGFRVPDLFVVGYGLDYGTRYRELPDICELRFREKRTRTPRKAKSQRRKV
jgi:hypoxanthine phosphoribosyltransferase